MKSYPMHFYSYSSKHPGPSRRALKPIAIFRRTGDRLELLEGKSSLGPSLSPHPSLLCPPQPHLSLSSSTSFPWLVLGKRNADPKSLPFPRTHLDWTCSKLGNGSSCPMCLLVRRTPGKPGSPPADLTEVLSLSTSLPICYIYTHTFLRMHMCVYVYTLAHTLTFGLHGSSSKRCPDRCGAYCLCGKDSQGGGREDRKGGR